ncbi:glutathione-regulated potassium-efflux system protein KefB [Artemisia annua]|uniref:Glutathione-regulated potassium-efflux system protein KefB n=1 Tax=Artemisia annua TaxID=35608 RepID=A0A2U1MB08_ARTAN|nr:glutathione-regulated potassium-efflux system protein KefB [Artemisia annua]
MYGDREHDKPGLYVPQHTEEQVNQLHRMYLLIAPQQQLVPPQFSTNYLEIISKKVEVVPMPCATTVKKSQTSSSIITYGTTEVLMEKNLINVIILESHVYCSDNWRFYFYAGRSYTIVNLRKLNRLRFPLSVEKLSNMKKYVSGLGSTQVLVAAVVIGLDVHFVCGQLGPAAIAFLDQPFKRRPSPCEVVINVMWEGVHSAHGCLLLWWVPRDTVVSGQVGNNHLSVALSTKCTRFKKWLLEI